MASTWGGSWGTSWASSWGAVGVVTSPVISGGVRNKRRWALKRDGKYRYFDDLDHLEAFKAQEDEIIIPRKTEAQAKSIGYVKSALTDGDFDVLRKIEREIDLALADERDDEDFVQFLATL